MPTDTTVIEQIIDPVPEDVAEIEALEGNMVHISGTETITGLKTFSQEVTAPEFIGIHRGGIVDGILLGDLDMNGFAMTGIGGTGFEELANKGVVNGYAPLGATGLVPAANLGTGGAGAGDNFLADDGQYRPISAGAVSFGTQAANLVFAGPGSGAAAAPAFRLMVAADIPTLAQSKITNLESDLLGKVPTTRTITEGAGLAGNVYDLSANRTLAMGTPSLLSVISANSASGTTHSHAITSSSNPGAVASILATDASGFLTIPRLTLTDRLLINALTANLFLKDTSTGFQVATTGIVTPQTGNIWRNTSYTSGVRGWNIDDAGNVEFQDGIFRGELRSSVFKVSEISATAGTFGVFKSAANLEADFTTPASTSTSFAFSAKNSDAGGMLFELNDVVRFKTWTGAGISDAWATITARTNAGAYTNYTATLNSGSTSATFRAGTGVVDYGPSGTGFITLSADGTVGSSPNLTMATHAGSPWTTQTTLLRAGNLNGSFGYATNVYGVGIGQYGAAQSWLTFDTTNGLRIGNNTTTLANWDTSGNILLGQTGAGQGNVYISSGALQMRVGTTVFGQWDTSGNATFGNVATNQANVYWNSVNDRLEFRGSTNGTVVQSYIDTDGAFTAGAGAVKLNQSGLSFDSSESEGTVLWQDPGNNNAFVQLEHTSDAGASRFHIDAFNSLTGASTTKEAGINLTAQGNTGGSYLYIKRNDSALAPNSTGWANFGGDSTYAGVSINAPIPNAPTHMLDVYGTGMFFGNGTAPLFVAEVGKALQLVGDAAGGAGDGNFQHPSALNLYPKTASDTVAATGINFTGRRVSDGFNPTAFLIRTVSDAAGAGSFQIWGASASNLLTQGFTYFSTGGVSIGGTTDPGAGKFTIANSHTPASAAATGIVGTIAWDASFIYVCTATNTWKRAAIATW